jgi:hypothetical protein
MFINIYKILDAAHRQFKKKTLIFEPIPRYNALKTSKKIEKI